MYGRIKTFARWPMLRMLSCHLQLWQTERQGHLQAVHLAAIRF